MLVASGSSANWIEIGWLLAGLVGVCFSGMSLVMGILDWREIRRQGKNGTLRLVADSSIFTEVMRLSINLVVMGIGIWALKMTPSPYPQTAGGWFIVSGLMWMPVATTINSMKSVYIRRAILGKEH